MNRFRRNGQPEIRVLLLAVALFAGSAASRRLLRNPIVPNKTQADPHAVVFGNTYYLYPTYSTEKGNSFSAWSSQDLVNWQLEKVILQFGSDVKWAEDQAWAPAMIERNGKYYFYFSADDRIGVAVGDSPTGPFADPLGQPLVPYEPDLSTIDPMAFIDDDGQAYLYYGAVPGSWRKKEASVIYNQLFVRKLNKDMVSFAGPRQFTIGTGDNGPHIEGSFVFKRKGIYYLMASEGNWNAKDDKSAYRVIYATATSPVGPFVKAKNNPILSTNRSLNVIGPGHHSVIRIPGTDEYYIIYHHHKGDANRRVSIDRLRFNGDGTIKSVVITREGVAPKPLPIGLSVENQGPYQAGTPVSFRATLAEKAGPVRKVEFFRGTQKIGEAAKSPYRFAWQEAPPGFHRVWARVIDQGGASKWSNHLAIDIE